MGQPISVTPTELVQGFKWFRDNLGLGWTLMGIETIAVIAFAVWFYFRRYRPLLARLEAPKKPTFHGPVFLGLSYEAEGDVSTIRISGTSLREFKDGYNVAVIGGARDPSVDKYEDDQIIVTRPYTIAPHQIDIQCGLSPRNIALRDKTIADTAARIRAANPEATGRFPVSLHLPLWHEVVLLPKSVRSGDIRTLADVLRHGGLIASKEVKEGRIVQVIQPTSI